MTAPAASPCINVCQMDEASGWCRGCLRTLDEIAFWSVLDEDDKQAVLALLPQRRVLWVQQQAGDGPRSGGQATA